MQYKIEIAALPGGMKYIDEDHRKLNRLLIDVPNEIGIKEIQEWVANYLVDDICDKSILFIECLKEFSLMDRLTSIEGLTHLTSLSTGSYYMLKWGPVV